MVLRQSALREKLVFGEHEINFKAPYARVTMTDAIKNFTGFDISGKTENEIREAAKAMGIEVDSAMGKGKLIDEIFGEKCEANYIQPTFITDYPKEMSPFSHDVLYYQPLPITRYQVRFYANNYSEQLPIVSTAFKDER